MLLRDVPKSPDDPGTCLSHGRPAASATACSSPTSAPSILGDVAVASARAAGTEVVDPTPWLCYQGDCPIVIGGTLTYRDTDHLTTEYAANLWASSAGALRMLPDDRRGQSPTSRPGHRDPPLPL